MKALTIALLLALLPASALATGTDTPHPPASYAAHAKEQITQVMADDAFGIRRTHMSMQLRKPPEPKKEAASDAPAWLLALSRLFGLLGQFMVWILLAAFLALVFFSRHRWLPLLGRVTTGTRTPAVLPGLLPLHATATEPMPMDVAAAAEACWQSGDVRAALSLLYRGALANLRTGIPELADSATERENLRQVNRAAPGPVAKDFGGIVRAWQDMAYANRQPAAFDELLGSFRRHFAGRRNS